MNICQSVVGFGLNRETLRCMILFGFCSVLTREDWGLKHEVLENS